MTIIFRDGSIMDCGIIELCGGELFVDGYRVVPLADVDRIEE